ncbi:MAG: 30S ribosomal protein S6 [Alphaproteobacteria bacterium]|nr:MAG: 30S ribosomal protein S6 [Alphaproteobacteria bacterium]
MNLYESVFIARQDLSSKQVEELVEKFSKIVADFKGNVLKTEFSGLRPLAYPIQKNRKGHYVIMYIQAPGTFVTELERTMKLREEILRFITLELESVPEGSSPLLKQARLSSEGDNNHGSPRTGDDRTHHHSRSSHESRQTAQEG